MTFLDRMVAEIHRRSMFLAQEVQTWKADADTNAQDLGIHQSQLRAIELLMDELQQRQAKILAELTPTLPLTQFSQKYNELHLEIVSAHDLWRIFRFIFQQRHDKRIQRQVDAADLIAANCYLSCMEQAWVWKAVPEGKSREPPLVYIDAAQSPATASRDHQFAALELPLRKYRTQQLPIPIIVLPADHVDCIWLFCTLHHEVGHNLAQDLKLQEEIKQYLETQLKNQGLLIDERRVWERWISEIIADAFGVLLGGPGFVYTMTSLLLLRAPLATAIRTNDVHPDDFVRVHLMTAMLSMYSTPAFQSAADEIKQLCTSYPTPRGAKQYLAVCELVASVVLTQPLAALKYHAIQELVPDFTSEFDTLYELERFLHTGFKQPDLANLSYRLVPSAAQMAFRQANPLSSEALMLINQRALECIAKLHRPRFLFADRDNTQFLRQLVHDLDFNQDG